MKHCTLNCAAVETLPQLHAHLRELLEFPDYYGENFDALYDCLTELGAPVCLEVRDLKRSGLGVAAKLLRQVLLDAAQSNPNLSVVFTRTKEAAE